VTTHPCGSGSNRKRSVPAHAPVDRPNRPGPRVRVHSPAQSETTGRIEAETRGRPNQARHGAGRAPARVWVGIVRVVTERQNFSTADLGFSTAIVGTTEKSPAFVRIVAPAADHQRILTAYPSCKQSGIHQRFGPTETAPVHRSQKADASLCPPSLVSPTWPSGSRTEHSPYL
jgi:hypothetical protein